MILACEGRYWRFLHTIFFEQVLRKATRTEVIESRIQELNMEQNGQDPQPNLFSSSQPFGMDNRPKETITPPPPQSPTRLSLEKDERYN